MIAVIRRNRRVPAIAEIALEVTCAVGERLSQDERYVLVRTVPVRSGDRREVLSGEQRIVPTGVVIVVVNTCTPVNAYAFEMIIHHEVHDTGDGVSAIRGRGTARQHIHTLDQCDRDLVDVGCRCERRRRSGRCGRITALQTATVNQNQSALGAKTTKIDRRRPVRAHGQARALICDNLRQAVQ